MTPKSKCSNIGFFLFVSGIIACGVANQMHQHNTRLTRDVYDAESRIDSINRRARNASSPETALRNLAEDRLSERVNEHSRASMRQWSDSYAPSLIGGLYQIGGLSVLLGIVLCIVGLILPNSLPNEQDAKTLAVRQARLELAKENEKQRIQERENEHRLDEKRKTEERERIRQRNLEEEKRRQALLEKERCRDEEKRKQQSMIVFQEAVDFYSSLQLDKALERCDKAVKLFPHPNALLLRAWINESKENFRYVVRDCTDALRLDADLREAHFVRGKALMGCIENATFFFNPQWWSMAVDDFCAIPASDEHFQESRKHLALLHSKDYKSDCFFKTCFSFVILGGLAFIPIFIFIVTVVKVLYKMFV